MMILDQLATSLGLKDEAPNIALVQRIADHNDIAAVKELFALLEHKNKGIQGDSIKVIYEIAALAPVLIADEIGALIALLQSRNNRLQWGAMIAIHALSKEQSAAIYAALPAIIDAADKGSVITNDHCVGILISLCSIDAYAQNAFILLIERLEKCPTNQLPMYAENTLPLINADKKERFMATLAGRLSEMGKESKKKRVEQVLKKALNM